MDQVRDKPKINLKFNLKINFKFKLKVQLKVQVKVQLKVQLKVQPRFVSQSRMETTTVSSKVLEPTRDSSSTTDTRT